MDNDLTNNKIKVYTTSAPGGLTVSTSNIQQTLDVTNNKAREYADLAKKYRDETKDLRDDAKYYAEQNADVTMSYVNELEARLQRGIDSKQTAGDYALNSAIPANVSSLTNDSQYVNTTQLGTAIDSVRLPSQTGNDGKFLYTNGETPSWEGVNGLCMFDIIEKDHVLSYAESKGYVQLGEYAYKEAVAGSHYGYPNFYSKCLEESNDSNNTLEIIKNNYTIVGSPTVTSDGIVSGFSSSNYLTFLFNMSNYVNFKEFVMTVKKLTSDTGVLVTSNDKKMFLWQTASNKMSVNWRKGSGTDAVIYHEFTVNPDTSVYKIVITPTTLALYEDGVINSAGTIPITTNDISTTFTSFIIGNWNTNLVYGGSIDLKGVNISVDSIPVLTGNQTGIDIIKPDDYTVVGTPTISADGIASGLNSSNYINYITADILSGKNWKIIQKVYWDGSTTSNYLSISNIYTRLQITQYKELFAVLYTTAGEKVIKWVNAPLFNEAGWYYIGLKNDLSTGTFTLFAGRDLTNLQTYDSPAYGQGVEISNLTSSNYISSNVLYGITNGSIDLNSYKLYVDGDLVYQPCLKIPYTLSNTNKKVVDIAYRSRVQDMYEQFGYTPYYMSDEYREIDAYRAVDCISTNSNGHKYYDISNKPEIDDIYNSTGDAWYYGIDTVNELILLPRTSDINSGKYLYMVVGNSPNWTGVTDLINQGTAILNQVNRGINNAIETRLDLSVTNISSAGKNTVINWLMPDYTSGINFTTVPYTAPSNGICYVSTGAANATAVITVNGITVGKVGVHDGNEGSITIPVNEGDIISGTGNYGTPHGYFFPLKGV